MEGIEQKAIELIEKFEALAVDIAPDAIELGLMAARVSVFQNLVLAAALVLLSAGGYKITKALVSRSKEAGFDSEIIYELGALFTGLGTVASGAVGVLEMANLWNWVGIFYPELWIAKQVLGW